VKIFLYKCRQGSVSIEGYIEAESVADASRKLETKGFIVLQIKMYNMGSSAVALQTQLVPFSFKEKKDFYTSFYRQYKAGIPWLKRLTV